MLIPIGDDNTQRTITPYVNYILIAINIFVFFYFQGLGANEAFTLSFSTVPKEILTGTDIAEGGLGVTPVPVYLTLLTSMFMHGGYAHIIGNMMYLWIFGDNLENRMGHARYLGFYIICGIIASVAHVLVSFFVGKNLYIPSLGASGAISGVLGGYLLLFPKNQVRIFALITVLRIPAFISLGLWIGLQLWDGYNDLSVTSGGGVAYGAHIGGFIAGVLLVKVFSGRPLAVGHYK